MSKPNSKYNGTKKSMGALSRRKRGKYGLARKSTPHIYGALDLGTNNCRLLLAQPAGTGFRVVASFSRIVRLGEGLTETGLLSDAAMNRTIMALSICSDKLKFFKVFKSRNVATEACRRATNCNEFLTRINIETGLQFQTVTSNEEAQLALRGCQNLLNHEQPHALVFDIGGGSTEIIWAKNDGINFNILDVLSLPFGVLTLAEEFITDQISNTYYEKMVSHIMAQLPIFCARNNIKENILKKTVQMLGTSGTVTTLGAVHLNLSHYDRSSIDGLGMTFDELGSASRKLIEVNYQDRSKMPCIGVERAELAIPGCAILEAICRAWPIGRLRVADRGLREGMLLELMTEDGVPVTGNPAANRKQNSTENFSKNMEAIA
jgi:exopolyphosphatase/guanosine-5'-triphosphate,3'-diphosphate pyrophosphatase